MKLNVTFRFFVQHGKNFEAIKAHVEKKHLSNKADPGLVKTKEQVRHLYYRTWAKISKYIQQKEGKQQVEPSALQGRFSRKEQIAYLLLIRPFWKIKLFMTRRQIRLLNSKTTDLDWYHSRYYQKLK